MVDEPVDPTQTALFGTPIAELVAGLEVIPLSARDREAVEALPPGTAPPCGPTTHSP